MEDQNPIHIVIIGGVAGGASAAARARRLSEHAQITLIERGPDVSFANCGLPYFIGGEIQDRSRLALQTPQSLKALLNINVLTLTEATAINRQQKTVTLHGLTKDTITHLNYDKLILSPGASPLIPPLPGIEDEKILTLRNLQDMDRIREKALDAQRVIIVGAGFIGLEMAEQLIHLHKKVTLIELQDQVLPQLDPEMVRPMEKELREHGVELLLGTAVSGFAREGDQLLVKAGKEGTIATDLVILSIGVRPETDLAKACGLTLGTRGHLTVNAFQQTSDPDIYGVGDAVETLDPILQQTVAIPLGGPANRQGRIAADHILRGTAAKGYPGSLGTSIVRVFDLAAGVTGYTEKRLNQCKTAYETTTITDYHHANYYPGAVQLTVKIVWDPADGRLLGAQVYGPEGVDKRLDVLATALRGNLTIDDLSQLELAYAPPFGSAKDAVNIAGFAATNRRDGLVNPILDPAELPNAQLVDVRPEFMASADPIPGAIAIPVTSLRTRLGEIDKQRPVITFCALGKMSYFASRILQQNGFHVRSLLGGLRLHGAKFKTPTSPVVTPQPSVPETPMPLVEPTAGTLAHLDVTGIACPGPIVRIRTAIDAMLPGQLLEIKASDSGFEKDIQAFCTASGNEFIDLKKEKGILTARIRIGQKKSACAAQITENARNTDATIVVFSQEMDKALAALVIANGALAMGGKATLFFTFWGLNVLRRHESTAVAGKTFMDKLFGWMMPQGMKRLPLSNMHIGGMGTALMKWRMGSKNLPNLPGLLADAQKGGVRIVACTMSMDAMGIRAEELISGVELGGVADYLGQASTSRVNLFI
jgi:NADPH-dependent 2,4-dienoyl-CoA reductase/sulfur reductase-like enzyme/peroxiredoxin family protein/TusA-related sulfurtransferase/rhodanese-related sulfurtransferase